MVWNFPLPSALDSRLRNYVHNAALICELRSVAPISDLRPRWSRRRSNFDLHSDSNEADGAIVDERYGCDNLSAVLSGLENHVNLVRAGFD